jgi:hypothetical protein
MDPGTGLTILGGAVGSAKLLEKILGPTADYIGSGVRDWTQRAVQNLGTIFKKAHARLGHRIEGPGSVPPKVLKGILAEGAFCEDDVTAEYYAGVLASSRSEVGRDDRGAAMVALIGRLSTYQIRSHYFLYRVIKALYDGLDVSLASSDGRNKLLTFVPFTSYVAALDFSAKENLAGILSHVMFGLSREDLIGDGFQYGSPDELRNHFPSADQGGILFAPSALGAELFLWAHGEGNRVIHHFLKTELLLPGRVDVPPTPGIRSTAFPDRSIPGGQVSSPPHER